MILIQSLIMTDDSLLENENCLPPYMGGVSADDFYNYIEIFET